MKFFKTSTFLSLLLLSTSHVFGVVIVGGDKTDEEYKTAAQPYKAVGMIKTCFEENGFSQEQLYTATLIAHKDKQAVLTAASAFWGAKEEACFISEGQSYEITKHQLSPKYEKSLARGLKAAASENFALAFLAQPLTGVTPLSFKTFTSNNELPQKVKVVGCGRSGNFNAEGFGSYKERSGTKRLYETSLQAPLSSRAAPQECSLEAVLEGVSYSYPGAAALGDGGAPAFDKNENVVAVLCYFNDKPLSFMSSEEAYKDVPWLAKPFFVGIDNLLGGGGEGSVDAPPLKQSFYRFGVRQLVSMPETKLGEQWFMPITSEKKVWIRSQIENQGTSVQ